LRSEKAEAFPVDEAEGRLTLLIAEYESTTTQRDGTVPRFRRFALVAPPSTVLAQETVQLGSGGADHLEHEMRDVDGDGRADLVFFFLSRNQVTANTAGFVAATRSGRLVLAPMWRPVSTGVEKNATGCWTRIDGVPALVLLWSTWSLGGDDGDAHIGWSSSAHTVGGRGVEERTIYGVVVEEGEDLATLTSKVPGPHRHIEPEEWTPLAPDCSRSATPVVAVGEPRGKLSLIAGLSFTAAGAGAPWPEGVPAPSVRRVIAVPHPEK
jgi:hypothetical protein